ncbi:fasciclin domain-containing protein [Rubrivivax albus]|uniref:fasciclin domain-containing protein n=1 Tax=Rubrivivax albus TaxID=2499835 RepID=UPI002687FFFF|nr:fasciclin domain-containing protein [Rubrivivax albus]
MQRRHLLLATSAAVLLTACGGDSDPNLIEALEVDADLSLLLEAVRAAGLEGTLRGSGPFTLFAPTNAAFVALLTELGTTKDAVFGDTALLTAVLTTHVLGAEVRSAGVPVGQAVTTLQGGIVKPVAVGGGLGLVDGRNRTANVIAADIRCSNGVIHKIDRVLLPADKDIVQTAIATPQFSILVEAVVAAGLVDALSAPGPLTVFAPTDDAFAALLAELGITKDALLADTALLTAVLTYHVVPGRVLASGVPAGEAVTTLEGGIFKPTAMAGGLAISDGRNRVSNIVVTDVLASNGVIHVIDKVLLPADKDIVQTAIATPQFSILVEAVVAAGLVDALSAPGPLTVFAPTDDAFAALLTELGITKDALLADTALLTAVLTYHVVDGRVLASGVPIGADITTLQGGTFSVDADLAITDGRDRMASIVATDVLASNGVIHVIDRVILPAA